MDRETPQSLRFRPVGGTEESYFSLPNLRDRDDTPTVRSPLPTADLSPGQTIPSEQQSPKGGFVASGPLSPLRYLGLSVSKNTGRDADASPSQVDQATRAWISRVQERGTPQANLDAKRHSSEKSAESPGAIRGPPARQGGLSTSGLRMSLPQKFLGKTGAASPPLLDSVKSQTPVNSPRLQSATPKSFDSSSTADRKRRFIKSPLRRIGSVSQASGQNFKSSKFITGKLYESFKRKKKERESGEPQDGSVRFSATSQLLHSVSSILQPFEGKKIDTASLGGLPPLRHHQHSRDHYLPPVFDEDEGRHTAISIHSKISSLRRFLLGKPPQNTPGANVTYRGSDGLEYLEVNITAPSGPSYLPSEAQRVSTPPMPTEAGRKSKRQVRGFFFDYNNPGSADKSEENEAEDVDDDEDADKFLRSPRKVRLPSMDVEDSWFKSAEVEDDGLDEVDLALLKWHIPDHLPSSPLCPANAKYYRGGNKLCPWHGLLEQVDEDKTNE